MTRGRWRDDAGFTLVELLITVVITALIVGPMSAAIVLGFRTSDDTATRLAGSHDAQLLATYLVPDVEGVRTAGDADSSPGHDPGCATSTPGTNVLTLAALLTPTVNSLSPTVVASYRRNGPFLERYVCFPGGSWAKNLVGHDIASITATVSGTFPLTATISITEKGGYTFTVSAASARARMATELGGVGGGAGGTCSVGLVGALPNPVGVAANGHLAVDVAVSVATFNCSLAITIEFTPSTTAHSILLTNAGNGIWTGTIGRNAYNDWVAGPKLITVKSGGKVISNSYVLTVTACTASGTASPNPVSRLGAHLASNVLVSVSTSGQCSPPFAISFNTGTQDVVLPLNSTGPNWTGTINRDAYTWTDGTHTITVSDSNGAVATIPLAVSSTTSTTSTTQPPTTTTTPQQPCSVTSASGVPNHVNQGGGGHLLKDIKVTVQTTGGCSGLKVRYAPSSVPKDVALTQAGNTWTGTLSKNDSWTVGNHTVEVLDTNDTQLATFVITVCSSGC